jgi:hypothetical protein
MKPALLHSPCSHVSGPARRSKSECPRSSLCFCASAVIPHYRTLPQSGFSGRAGSSIVAAGLPSYRRRSERISAEGANTQADPAAELCRRQVPPVPDLLGAAIPLLPLQLLDLQADHVFVDGLERAVRQARNDGSFRASRPARARAYAP